ncbi:acyl-CoA thioesterase [Halovenus salina]|uniref:Acyl-CoA thioesterase n=1 Tax=Halovenus salina TaxID=1510225 RepID=A0ABD5W1X6_9EURY|nr:acyl-CoA thioesterase [Halovenus salina]
MDETNEAVPLSESQTEMTEMLLPDSTNALGRALGGVVLHWMDICGAISAMRFANRQCVTASMDHVDFIAPIDVGEIAVVKAYAFNTGRTSVDVKVDVHSEDPRTGEKQETTTSFLTFVAIDDDGNPTTVPDVVCETDAEKQLRQEAVEKRQKELESIIERMREDY